MEKDLNDWSKAEFEALEYSNHHEDIGEFDSLVILPTKDIHDSDYRCMAFIACKGNKPIAKIGGGSDVIHINGIGGYGKDWLYKQPGVPKSIEPIGWSIDCLKKSKLLRLFTHQNLVAGKAYSSFEIYSVKKQVNGKEATTPNVD